MGGFNLWNAKGLDRVGSSWRALTQKNHAHARGVPSGAVSHRGGEGAPVS